MKNHFGLLLFLMLGFSVAHAQQATTLDTDSPLLGAWELDAEYHQNVEDGVLLLRADIDTNVCKSPYVSGSDLPDSLEMYCQYLIFKPGEAKSYTSNYFMDLGDNSGFMKTISFIAKSDGKQIIGNSLGHESVILNNLKVPFSFKYKLMNNNERLVITTELGKFYFKPYVLKD